MEEASIRMRQADKMVFMGTSFSVNITNIALDIARKNNIEVEVIDPNPVILPYANVTYHKMTALEYINR
jgi:NAD-dependent deacetylase